MKALFHLPYIIDEVQVPMTETQQILEIAQIPATGSDVIFPYENDDSKTTRLRVSGVALVAHNGKRDYDAVITLEEIPPLSEQSPSESAET